MLVAPAANPATVLFLRLVLALATLGRFTELIPTSWSRTPERNAEVGGKPGSLHVFGLALDLQTPAVAAGASALTDPDLQRFAALWRSLGLDAVLESDHLHVELDGPLLRRS